MTGIFQRVIELINLDYNRWIEYLNKSFLNCNTAFVMATSPADNIIHLNNHLNLRKYMIMLLHYVIILKGTDVS